MENTCADWFKIMFTQLDRSTELKHELLSSCNDGGSKEIDIYILMIKVICNIQAVFFFFSVTVFPNKLKYNVCIFIS